MLREEFKCPTCGASFKTENELMEHAKIHMKGSQASSFKCEACGLTFAFEAELKHHARQAHRM